MKDAYSFDRDEEGVTRELRARTGARTRGSSSAAGSRLRRPGRERDHGRQVQRRLPRARRARARTCSSRCENGDYAADLRGGAGDAAGAELPGAARRAARRWRRPASRRSRRSRSSSASIRPRRRRRCRSTKPDGTLVLALVRGDDRLSETKLYDALQASPGRRRTRRSAPPSARAAARSGRSASTGEVIADETLRKGQFVAGANRDGWHLRGVEAGRDFEPRFADVREPKEGDSVPDRAAADSRSRPRSRSGTSSTSAASTRSRSTRRSSTRTARRSRSSAAATGSGRAGCMAAIVEQRHDEHGIVWPREVVAVRRARRRAGGGGGDRRAGGGGAVGGGLDVLLDDRDLRAGREVRRRRSDRHARSGSQRARRASRTEGRRA